MSDIKCWSIVQRVHDNITEKCIITNARTASILTSEWFILHVSESVIRNIASEHKIDTFCLLTFSITKTAGKQLFWMQTVIFGIWGELFMSATKLFTKVCENVARYWAYPIVGIPWYLYLELITNLIRSLCLIFVIKNLKYFSQCATYMTGVYRQGIHCQTCGYNSHYRCTKFVPGVCPLPVDDLKKRIGINSVNIQGKNR